MCIMRNYPAYSEYCKPSSTVLVSVTTLKKSYPESFSVPVVGTGEQTDINCGKTKIVLRCSNSSHPPILKPYNCTSPMCPECYKYWISSATDRITSQLTAIYQPIKYDNTDSESTKLYQRYNTLAKHSFRHWTLSYPDNLKGEVKPYDIIKIFRRLSCFGLAIYHPYRLTDFGKDVIRRLRASGSYSGGNWDIWHSAKLYDNEDTFYLSPHIHLIMVGYVPSKFQDELVSSGYVLKNIREVGRDSFSVGSLCGYLLTHAGYFGKSKSYRYFGFKRGVSVVVNTFWSQPQKVLCPVCGEPLREYVVSSDGALVDNGYAVECRLIYESFLQIRKKLKPNDAKYSQYVKMMTAFKKVVKKEEEEKECIRNLHLVLFR